LNPTRVKNIFSIKSLKKMNFGFDECENEKVINLTLCTRFSLPKVLHRDVYREFGNCVRQRKRRNMRKTKRLLDLKILHEREAEIFGGGGKGGRRSQVVVRVESGSMKPIQSSLFPHKPFMMKGNAIPKGHPFYIHCQMPSEIFSYKEKKVILNMDAFENLIVLVSLLGGIGKRSRRGMGSFRVKTVISKYVRKEFRICSERDLLKLLSTINKNSFSEDKTKKRIITQFSPKNRYPFIKSIRIGNTDSNLLYKINQTTHDLNLKYKNEYGNAMGKIHGGRFSSPVYVTVAQIDKVLTYNYCIECCS
jgi:CRISPR-associated protein Cmr1